MKKDERGKEFERKSSTPTMTEQSHKKRFTVIYEIINRGVALADGNRGGVQTHEDTRVQKKFNPFLGPLTVAGDLGGRGVL